MNIGDHLIPGERAFREHEWRWEEGIVVEDALMEEIKSLRFQGGHTPSEYSSNGIEDTRKEGWL